MNMDHKEIKELLPDYLHGNTSEELSAHIQSHLEDCMECSEEHKALSGLVQMDVPDPGDLYWKTLPQRIRATIEEEQRDRLPFYAAYLKPIAAVVVAIVIFTFAYVFTSRNDPAFFDPAFQDPFAETYIDYDALQESIIPSFSIEIAENDLFMNGDMFEGHSYHYELSALSFDELDVLNKRLANVQPIGG